MSANQILVKLLGTKCSICGSTQNVELHHKDRDRKNNDLSNIMLLCRSCHHKQYKRRNHLPNDTGVKGKFIQSLSEETYRKLGQIAKEKGINVQELIRAVIIPEWLETKKETKH